MRRADAFTVSMVTIVVALSVAAPAAAAGGPAVPSGSFNRAGVTGPPGLPSSEFRYVTVSAGNRTVIEQIKTDGGIPRSSRAIHGLWALPAVTIHLGGPRRLPFSARGKLTGPTWSPDGRWLLVGWPAADQWLFISADERDRVIPFDRISEQFDPGASEPSRFPRVAGWVLPQR